VIASRSLPCAVSITTSGMPGAAPHGVLALEQTETIEARHPEIREHQIGLALGVELGERSLDAVLGLDAPRRLRPRGTRAGCSEPPSSSSTTSARNPALMRPPTRPARVRAPAARCPHARSREAAGPRRSRRPPRSRARAHPRADERARAPRRARGPSRAPSSSRRPGRACRARPDRYRSPPIAHHQRDVPSASRAHRARRRTSAALASSAFWTRLITTCRTLRGSQRTQKASSPGRATTLTSRSAAMTLVQRHHIRGAISQLHVASSMLSGTRGART
jgi:hypothetical protein